MTEALEEEIVLKLLHTADWHLGRRFPRIASEELERKLTRARADALGSIFGLADRHEVHAVLCAGDLFDEPNPLPEWWRPLVDQLRKRSSNQRPVVLLPGNHDPLLPDSVWAGGSAFRAELPPWVHVVDRTPFELELEGGAVLYAVPCCSRAGSGDPTASIPAREPGDERVRVGLVHGSTFDMPGCELDFPIARDAALERGLDYLALGDTHGFRFVPPDRRVPPTVYPGAPEPTAYDERDAGNVAVVRIDRRRNVRVEAERVARWTWEELTVRSMTELRQLRQRGDLDDRVLRLHLELTVSAPEHAEAERILADLQGTSARHARVGVLELDRGGFKLEVGSIEQHLKDLPEELRETARRLREQASNSAGKDAQVAERALVHLYQVSRRASA